MVSIRPCVRRVITATMHATSAAVNHGCRCRRIMEVGLQPSERLCEARGDVGFTLNSFASGYSPRSSKIVIITADAQIPYSQ